MLLRDYQPYDRSTLAIHRFSSLAPNDVERQRMDAKVEDVLDTYSIDEYFGSRYTEAIAAIERVHENAGERISGHVVDFAAGTCKLGGFLSKLPEVERVTCVDFSEPLLTEIAPRMISRLGGDLSKVDFMVADMNRLPELGLGKIDWLVGYYAVHHLDDPRAFFTAMRDHVDGVFAYREPMVPTLPIPTAPMRAFLRAQAGKRREGEFERNFSLLKYRRVAPGYDFRSVPVYGPRQRRLATRIRETVGPVAWYVPYDVAYVLRPKR